VTRWNHRGAEPENQDSNLDGQIPAVGRGRCYRSARLDVPVRMRGHPWLAVALMMGALVACGTSVPRPEPFGTFGELTPVMLQGYTGEAMEPFISRDGHFLLYNTRNDGPDPQLRFAERLDDVTFVDRGELPGAGSPALEGTPSMDSQGTLYFVSTRSYAQDLETVYRGQFDGTRVNDISEVSGLSRKQLGWIVFDVEVTSDGDTLWLAEGLFSGGAAPDSADLLLARGHAGAFARDPDGTRILAAVNSSALEYAPAIGADGLELFFTRADASAGTASLWRAGRSDVHAPFGAPERILAASGFVEGPSLSPDGHVLYFHRNDGGRYGLWCIRR
jgi:hypothetical protein